VPPLSSATASSGSGAPPVAAGASEGGAGASGDRVGASVADPAGGACTSDATAALSGRRSPRPSEIACVSGETAWVPAGTVTTSPTSSPAVIASNATVAEVLVMREPLFLVTEGRTVSWPAVTMRQDRDSSRRGTGPGGRCIGRPS
jgi:hypothetical protein